VLRGDRSAAPGALDCGRDDILSLLQARDEHGEPMTDAELRDELMTSSWPATRRRPPHWPGRSSGSSAPPPPRPGPGELEAGGAPIWTQPSRRPCVCGPSFPLSSAGCSAMELQGYALPAGSHVAPCIFLAHRRPDVYPDPWRSARAVSGPRRRPYAWLPFGVAPGGAWERALPCTR
jgi:hypothetical protein